MQQYVLGLDNGNTMTKAAIFDMSGREIAVCAEPVSTLYPQPGHTERDMQELWLQSARAIAAVIKSSGINPAQIAALGCSGHGNGVYLLDRQRQPLKAIQSLDSRATEMVEQWREQGLGEQIYKYNLQGIWPAQTAVLLAWLKRYDSAVYDQIGTAFCCKDYINYCLTGQLCSDFTDISGAGLMNISSREIDPQLLQLYGLSEAPSYLPKLSYSTDIIGQVTAVASQATGLHPGTPVIAGMFDVVAGALGSAVDNTGQGSVIAGTWSINQVVVDQPVDNPQVFMNCIFDRQRYLLIESSATSATNLDWFVREFCHREQELAKQLGGSVFDFCNQQVASVGLAVDLPFYLPFLHGCNEHENARAGFYGVAGWHTKAHLLHAVYEGVVFAHLSHVNKLRDAGAPFSSASLAGGGANSEIWSQMFADVLNVPIKISCGSEIGAKGAALSAAVAVGLFADISSAVVAMCSIDKIYQPNAGLSPSYQKRYQHYQLLVKVMAEPWRLQAMLED
ncbi:carbohydrate kinase ['Osedax' symbiont bacterium Rs2_46_30_T18]|nr:carbohydrate kinase ['Osedax' symbiont bacterium Rs2_46_30_T18]